MSPDEILKYIPERYQGWIIVSLIVLPYITRAYHALINGGGLRGVYRAILFGTNTPPPKDDEK